MGSPGIQTRMNTPCETRARWSWRTSSELSFLSIDLGEHGQNASLFQRIESRVEPKETCGSRDPHLESEPSGCIGYLLHASPGVYAVLVGSGMSTAAGIKTAWGVVQDLIRRVKATSEGVNPGPSEERPEEGGWLRADLSPAMTPFLRSLLLPTPLVVLSFGDISIQPLTAQDPFFRRLGTAQLPHMRLGSDQSHSHHKL